MQPVSLPLSLPAHEEVGLRPLHSRREAGGRGEWKGGEWERWRLQGEGGGEAGGLVGVGEKFQ